MQNSKCRMQNCGMPCGHEFKIIGEADTIILHFAFCILHSNINSCQRQELMLAVMSRMLFCMLLSPFFRATSTLRMLYRTVE